MAGLKTLEILRRPGSYEKLRKSGEQVMNAIRKNLQLHKISHQIMGDPVMFDVVFTDSAVKNYADMLRAAAKRSRRFWLSLREQRVIKSDNKTLSVNPENSELEFNIKKSQIAEVAGIIALIQNTFAVTTEQKYVFWYKI